MSNFVLDSTTLAFPKENLVGVPPGANTSKYLRDVDWNEACQAAYDLRSVLKNQLAYNVKDYGAVGNGTTNDAPAIQALIDTVGAAGGGVIYFPDSTYKLWPTAHVANTGHNCITISYDNVILLGQSREHTILSCYVAGGLDPTTDWELLDNGSVWRGTGIYITAPTVPTPRKNVEIINLRITGNAPRQTGLYPLGGSNPPFPADPGTGNGWDITHKGIYLDYDRYHEHFRLINCEVDSFRGELVYYGGAYSFNSEIRNCRIHDTNANCVNISSGLIWTDTECYDASAGCETAPGVGDSIFARNNIHDVNTGISAWVPSTATGNFQITGNLLRNCHLSGITLGAVEGGIQNVHVVDNDMYDCGTAGDQFINISSDSPYESNNIVVENNTMWVDAANCGQGLHLSGVCKNVIIRNNTLGRTPNAVANGYTAHQMMWHQLAADSTVRIERNNLMADRLPIFLSTYNTAPLFVDNVYTMSNGTPGSPYNAAQFTTDTQLIAPHGEIVGVYVSGAGSNYDPVLGFETSGVQDGQRMRLIALDNLHAPYFPISGTGYELKSNRYLTNKVEFWVRYDATVGKWLEDVWRPLNVTRSGFDGYPRQRFWATDFLPGSETIDDWGTTIKMRGADYAQLGFAAPTTIDTITDMPPDVPCEIKAANGNLTITNSSTIRLVGGDFKGATNDSIILVRPRDSTVATEVARTCAVNGTYTITTNNAAAGPAFVLKSLVALDAFASLVQFKDVLNNIQLVCDKAGKLSINGDFVLGGVFGGGSKFINNSGQLRLSPDPADSAGNTCLAVSPQTAFTGSGAKILGLFTDQNFTTQVAAIDKDGFFIQQTSAFSAHAGGGQASATQLTLPICFVTVAASAGDSVKLPAPYSTGYRIVVTNATTNSIDVFPSSGHVINLLAANTALAVPAGQSVAFVSQGTANWWSEGLGSSLTIGTANGLSLSGSVLSMAAAGSSTTGAVTSGAQSFGGVKTFDAQPVLSAGLKLTGATITEASNTVTFLGNNTTSGPTWIMKDLVGLNAGQNHLLIERQDGTIDFAFQNQGKFSCEGGLVIGGVFGGGTTFSHASGKLTISPSVANGGSAVALVLTNQNTLSTSGAKIVSFSPDNGSTEKAYVDKDGLGCFLGGLKVGANSASVYGIGASTVFTANGTFTTASDSTTSTVYHYRMLGGGGGGGASGSGFAGGGGGAGAYAEGTFTGVAASTGITITVGAAGAAGSGGAGGNGGDSSIGSPVSITAAHGVGGAVGTSGSAAGGAGGTVTGSPNIVSMTGGKGHNGFYDSGSAVVWSGDGAGTCLGTGGFGKFGNGTGAGDAASAYGAGGGGGCDSGDGGAGKGGIVIITRLTP